MKLCSRRASCASMTTIRAFIFDLDGTLIDSLDDIADALNHGLRELRRSTATRDEVRDWIGDGLPMLCRRAAKIDDDELVHRLVALTTHRYRRHCVDATRPYRNILTQLELLRNRGLPLAVLSNKPHDLTMHILDRLNLRALFDYARGCTRDDDRKPSPRVALEIAGAMTRAPDEVMLVGDSEVDVATARNAGMVSVAVTWGFRSKSELEAVRPDHIIDSPDEIAALIDR